MPEGVLNGGPTWRWFAGIFLSILLLAGGAWANDVMNRLGELEDDVAGLQGIHKRLDGMDNKLTRLEDKLDRITRELILPYLEP